MSSAVTARRRPTARSHAERRQAAESRIVQAAFDIVARRGVDQVTLAEAGEEAGYSRALAAHYFASKEALLAAVAEHALEKYRLRMLAAIEPGRTGREAVLDGIAFYFNETRKWPKRLRAFFEVMNAGLRWPSIAPTVARLNAIMIERFANHIRSAQDSGQIRANLDAKAEAIAITGAMRGIMGQWLIDPDSIDLDTVRDNFIAGLRRSWSA
ncbi:MAG: TetR/AcrR family transcriptional regulator [Alphaproteobacteria bacterium]|nr:TetR/AcrR family transcriptional regulator [Alphaproteobacteria bacterium]